jgi:peptidoglycan/xylan/chitin deacetylase (PgdA/CDA1 family)
MTFTQFRIAAAANAFAKVPVSLWEPLARARMLVPYYHLVSDVEVPHVRHLYPVKGTRQFERDLDFLLQQYEPLGMDDLLARIRTGTPVPRKTFLLTFDDGFREMHDTVAPILLKKGVPATFFISSAFLDNKALCHDHKKSLLIERLRRGVSHRERRQIDELLMQGGAGCPDAADAVRATAYGRRAVLDALAAVLRVDFREYLVQREPYLTSAKVRSLIDRGFCIGGHGIDHPPFPHIAVGEQVRQTVESVRFLKERFHLDYGVFAFPYSDRGVGWEFFAQVKATGNVDAFFGTSGLMDERIEELFQRISLERTLMPAEKIVAYQYARRCFKRCIGRSAVVRQ